MEIRESKRNFNLINYMFSPRGKVVVWCFLMLLFLLSGVSYYSYLSDNLPSFYLEVFGCLGLFFGVAICIGYRKRKYTYHVLEEEGIRSNSTFPFMKESFTYYRDFTKIGRYKENPLSGRMVFATKYLMHYSKGIGIAPAVEFYFDTLEEYNKFRDFLMEKNSELIEIVLDVTNPYNK